MSNDKIMSKINSSSIYRVKEEMKLSNDSEFLIHFIVNNILKNKKYLNTDKKTNTFLLDIYDRLGKNYSITLQIKEDHELITDGIYKYVRHPMYFVLILE
jgi:isoprenylcysteine carboxyl methyltransferase (ICMT) family protein YpbQ